MTSDGRYAHSWWFPRTRGDRPATDTTEDGATVLAHAGIDLDSPHHTTTDEGSPAHAGIDP